MGDLHTALRVDIQEDLLPLSALLHQRGVPHRIFEKGGRQVLKVVDPEQVKEVRDLYRAWRDGEVRIEISRRQPESSTARIGSQWRKAPVTLTLIILSVLGFLVYYLEPLRPLMQYLTFTPFSTSGNQLIFQNLGGEYWRLITPVFLHFGWLHIVFNCLWMWDLGVRVEQVMGRLNMILLFVVIAVVSNVSQSMFEGGLFGGMSGVVYGLLGFSWVAPLLQPRWRIQPPSSIMLFMVGWLFVCAFGVVEGLGFGAVANAAHFGGLICGAILGAAFGLLSRLDGDKDSMSQV